MLATNRTLPLAALALSLVALAGCGGGSGGGTEPPKKNTPDIAMQLGEAEKEFLALSQVALKRDFGDPPSTMVAGKNEFQVTKVTGDGNDGFLVSYMMAGGEEQTVNFTAGDFEAGECSRGEGCYYVEKDGEGFWLWSATRNFANPPRFEFFDVLGGTFPGGYRASYAYGIHTESAGLPAGKATWFGWMYSDTFLSNDPSNGQRTNIDGQLMLKADFAAPTPTLTGRIDRLRTRSRGENNERPQWEDLPETTWFAIESGSITATAAEFTANLTGMDTATNPAPDDTVLGYTGEVSGGFYGPDAEELGGVLHATSTTHGRVMAGYVAGRRLNSDVPGGTHEVVSVAVDRDYTGPSTALTDAAEVTAVASDGAGGFTVTYSVDGIDNVVPLSADDYGSQPDYPDIFSKRIANRSYALWSYTDSFFGPTEFDHFNVEGWSVADWNSSQTDMVESIKSGFVAYGTPTEVADLPAGTASYAGRVEGEIWSMDAAVRSEAMSHLLADFNLEADFANSTVGGMIHKIRVQEPGADDHVSATGEVAIQNGVIAQSGFTADLEQAPYFTGDMTGQFFGTDAAEVGGVINGTDSVGREVLQGWFGGTKQP